jgi:hypothetical protein
LSWSLPGRLCKWVWGDVITHPCECVRLRHKQMWWTKKYAELCRLGFIAEGHNGRALQYRR